MQKTLKATGSHVVLMPQSGKTDNEGRAISDGGIYLGREVKYPTAIVLSIGPVAAKMFPEIEIGQAVVYQRMLNSAMVLDGVSVEVIDVAEYCPKCKEHIRKGGIVGIIDDQTSHAETAQAHAT